MSGLFNEPLAVIVYVLIVLLVVVPIVLNAVRKPPAVTPAELEKESAES